MEQCLDLRQCRLLVSRRSDPVAQQGEYRIKRYEGRWFESNLDHNNLFNKERDGV